MDFKKILNTITSEKGEEILNELKEKGGSLTDMLQDKLQDTLKGKGETNQETGADKPSNPLSSGLEGLLQGKLKDLAEKAKSEIEAKIKK